MLQDDCNIDGIVIWHDEIIMEFTIKVDIPKGSAQAS